MCFGKRKGLVDFTLVTPSVVLVKPVPAPLVKTEPDADHFVDAVQISDGFRSLAGREEGSVSRQAGGGGTRSEDGPVVNLDADVGPPKKLINAFSETQGATILAQPQKQVKSGLEKSESIVESLNDVLDNVVLAPSESAHASVSKSKPAEENFTGDHPFGVLE